MSKHTPGPWEAWIQGAASMPITGPAAAATLTAKQAVDESSVVRDVCVIQIASLSQEAPALAFGDTKESAHANARLIAAAPDMLDALHDALEFVSDQEDVNDGPDGQPVANKAMRLAQTLRKAIRKATGEQA